MDCPIEAEELNQALNNTRLGKSPGSDGILSEALVHGGNRLRAFVLLLFNFIWTNEKIPIEWDDAIITILFKKGNRSQCGNNGGISLLSVVGKVFADVILQRLKLLAELIYPESQCGYRNGRGTIDGIFTLRQLMEKSVHSLCGFCESVRYGQSRIAFHHTPKFIRIIKKLYTDVHAKLIVDGELTKAFEYNSGVKQGFKLAPTLFGIYAAVLLWLAFKKINHTCSIQIRFRYDGVIFDLRRLKAKTKLLTEFIREAQYADDIAIFSDTPEGLHSMLTSYNDLAKRMGLRINTAKTETMCIGDLAELFIDGSKLANVTRFPNSSIWEATLPVIAL